MNKLFRPCVDRRACTEDGDRCRACGRTHEEIAAVRALTTEVTDFVLRMGYENSDEFLDYLRAKVSKKVRTARA